MSHERNQREKPAVVLVGADCITALQSARIFARYGIPVYGLAKLPGHPCCRTRFLERVIVYESEDASLIYRLVELAGDFTTPPVLLPCTDRSVIAISEHGEELAGLYRLQLPEHGTLVNLVDKLGFHSFADAEGFPVPRSRVIHSIEDLERAIDELVFPCYLKPYLKTEEWEANTRSKVFQVSEPDRLRELYRSVHTWVPKGLIVQEAVEGPDTAHFTCNCYFDSESRPLASFVSQKLRQWPIGIGVASLSLSRDNAEVRKLTIDFFQRARFRGLGYLEVKFDSRDGRLFMIEPNVGRPTGRSALAEASGIELLYTMYCDLTGFPLPPLPDAQLETIKWVYIRQDLRSAWTHWRRGELTLNQWFHSLKGRKIFPILSFSDPLPFFSDLLRCAFRALQRVGGEDRRESDRS